MYCRPDALLYGCTAVPPFLTAALLCRCTAVPAPSSPLRLPPLRHAVDRTVTPWVIVLFHTATYHNYVVHFKVSGGH